MLVQNAYHDALIILLKSCYNQSWGYIGVRQLPINYNRFLNTYDINAIMNLKIF